MRIYRDYRQVPVFAKGRVVAIGNFDGMHRGHKRVIEKLMALAAEHDAKPAVMTFEPHPRRFFNPERPVIRLFTFKQKAQWLEELGIHTLFAQRFNLGFASHTAEEFVREVLIDALGVSHVITGEDFRFGKGRAGDAALLKTIAKETGAFDYHGILPVGEGEEKFSSSMVREAVMQGDMEKAADILGRPYHWQGHVVKGDQRGRTIGFPTANIVPPSVVMPRFGVYAVRCQRVGDNAVMDGVANLGVRPTFNKDRALLEVHLLDQQLDLYDQEMQVEFISHIRDEQRFDGVEALQSQIQKDSVTARQKLSEIRELSA